MEPHGKWFDHKSKASGLKDEFAVYQRSFPCITAQFIIIPGWTKIHEER